MFHSQEVFALHIFKHYEQLEQPKMSTGYIPCIWVLYIWYLSQYAKAYVGRSFGFPHTITFYEIFLFISFKMTKCILWAKQKMSRRLIG